VSLFVSTASIINIVAGRTAQLLHKSIESLKLVSCHLGNGCSLAAIQNGHSIDTTMGFTPLEGLMMGTRSGSVDPGILTYLMRERRIDGPEIDTVLNQKSGPHEISGISGDMRQILAAIKQWCFSDEASVPGPIWFCLDSRTSGEVKDKTFFSCFLFRQFSGNLRSMPLLVITKIVGKLQTQGPPIPPFP
jgi:hypothetical protein